VTHRAGSYLRHFCWLKLAFYRASGLRLGGTVLNGVKQRRIHAAARIN
jgi:hypothetical protein